MSFNPNRIKCNGTGQADLGEGKFCECCDHQEEPMLDCTKCIYFNWYTPSEIPGGEGICLKHRFDMTGKEAKTNTCEHAKGYK